MQRIDRILARSALVLATIILGVTLYSGKAPAIVLGVVCFVLALVIVPIVTRKMGQKAR